MAFGIDLVVIALYFGAVISIGLYKGRGERTMAAFAIGDRSIPWWAVLASIVAAETSAATFLGAPGEGYALRNFTYAQLALGTILARVIVSYVFIKPYYDYRVVSIYEFLLVRFGVGTRNAASAVFLITRALASGTRLYVAAIVLVLGYEMVTKVDLLPTQEVWIYASALLFLTAMTAVYTVLGGIKAVVWTDVIQASVMFGALGFSIWRLLQEIPGGWAGAHAILNGANDLRFFDSGAEFVAPAGATGFFAHFRGIMENEYTLWAAFIGSTFMTMATHGTDQDMVQRMLTAKDHHRSRLALILSGLADLPIVMCFLFVGVLLWAHYQKPDLSNVFAHYILTEMPIGFRGLLVAGIFATAMGSLSTALNALATSYTEDWYRPYVRPGASDRQVVGAARWSTVVFSIILVIIGTLTAYAVVVHHSRIIPIVLGIFGYTYGSLLGVFLIGMLTKNRGSNRGNLFAMICGFLFVALLSGLHNDVWDLAHPDAAQLRHAREVLTAQLHRDPTTEELAADTKMAVAQVEEISTQPLSHVPLYAPAWLPRIEFVWRVAFGTVLTFFVGLCFRTPAAQREIVRAHLARAAA